MSKVGRQTLRLLNDMRTGITQDSVGWALSFRQRIRQLPHRGAAAVLCYVIATSTDQQTKRLAVWLRGHCGGTLGTREVVQACRESSDQIRKELVRTLQRTSAWSDLRCFAENDSSPRIRRLAAERKTRMFGERLDTFAEKQPVLPHDTKRQIPLFVDRSVSLFRAVTGKSEAMIRGILQRIQDAVRSD
ncbi:MAG: hypothetical protein KDA87_06030 [Planctomycetales bacterium]|nr:hypothetical protein [Planctomycetales bacterium]